MCGLQRLRLGCQLGITTARYGTMIDAGAEVTVTGTDAVSRELAQELVALGIRGDIVLQALFGEILQMGDAFHQIVQVVHRRIHRVDTNHVYATS